MKDYRQRKAGTRTAADLAEKKEGKLTTDELAIVDWEGLYFELERFKDTKSRQNLNLSRDAARRLLESATW